MQADPRWAGERLPVQILGVNGVGYDANSANDLMTQNRTLPWLQDTALARVWDLWRPTYRDVVVLDAQNRVIAVYNLTAHDLNRPAARDSLLQILEQAAQ
jgi:hypothetical protein